MAMRCPSTSNLVAMPSGTKSFMGPLQVGTSSEGKEDCKVLESRSQFFFGRGTSKGPCTFADFDIRGDGVGRGGIITFMSVITNLMLRLESFFSSCLEKNQANCCRNLETSVAQDEKLCAVH